MAIKNNYPTIRPSLDLHFAGSKVVDPRVTFTRPSTATYYDGKTVVKAEENLWTYSNTQPLGPPAAVTRMDNTAVAPDGTTTAFSITPTSGNVPHESGYVVSTPATTEKPATLSFHAKANGYTKLWFGDGSSARFYGLVDLNTAVITSSGGGGLVTASARLLENGWVRVFITVNVANNLILCPVPDSGYTTSNYGSATFAGDGVSGCYLWGFQAEQRDQATAYTPTTTQPITRYQPVLLTAPAGTPRIDHDPLTGECKGLLIEESRTNLLTYSSDFGNAAWSKQSANIIANCAVSPGGSMTATALIPVTTTGMHRAQQHYMATQNKTYTFSCYVKSAGSLGFILNTSGGAAFATFNLITASLTTTGGTADTSGVSGLITPVGNGWFRCSLTFTWVASTVGTSARIAVANSATNTLAESAFTGDGYSGIYVWGAQLEAGAFPTSYIKTEASQVTRAADNANMTGTNFSSWYRQDEGTAVVEANWDSGSLLGNSNRPAVMFADFAAPASNRVLFYNANSAPAAAIVSLDGVTQAIAGGSGASSADFVKAAAGYKTNDFAYSRKGGELTIDTQITLPKVDALFLGSTGGSGYLNGHIKRLTYYPKRLSNAQLQALTL